MTSLSGLTAAPHPDDPGEPGSRTVVLPDAKERGLFPRGVIILIGIAAAWFAILAMQGLKDIVAPTFFALNLMIVVNPIKTWLARRGIPEWLGSVVCGLVAFGLLIGFFASLGWALAVLVNQLPEYGGQFNDLYHQALGMMARAGVSQEQVTEAFKGFNPSSLMGFLGSMLSSISGGVTLLTVILTTLVFLIMDAMGFSQRMPVAAAYHPNLVGALESFAGGTRKYWVVCTAFGLIVAVLDLIVLIVFKVPLAIPWAILSFLTNYIPSIGFVIGLVPPALMALLTRGPITMLLVIVLYMVLNFIAQSIIQPKVAGDALGVTPTVTFLSLLFWAWVLGPLGTILALPATLFIKAVFIDADPQARWLNAFIAATPKDAHGDDDMPSATDPREVPEPRRQLPTQSADEADAQDRSDARASLRGVVRDGAHPAEHQR